LATLQQHLQLQLQQQPLTQKHYTKQRQIKCQCEEQILTLSLAQLLSRSGALSQSQDVKEAYSYEYTEGPHSERHSVSRRRSPLSCVRHLANGRENVTAFSSEQTVTRMSSKNIISKKVLPLSKCYFSLCVCKFCVCACVCVCVCAEKISKMFMQML